MGHKVECYLGLASKARQAILVLGFFSFFFFFIFLEKTLFEHLAASIYFPSSTFFPLILSLMAERPNQTAALFGIKLAS